MLATFKSLLALLEKRVKDNLRITYHSRYDQPCLIATSCGVAACSEFSWRLKTHMSSTGKGDASRKLVASCYSGGATRLVNRLWIGCSRSKYLGSMVCHLTSRHGLVEPRGVASAPSTRLLHLAKSLPSSVLYHRIAVVQQALGDSCR